MMDDNLILVVSAQVLVIGAVVAGIAVLLLRNLVCRARFKVNNKAVLITGCDSGVGFELAKHFDSLGFRVFAGVLDPCGEGASRLQVQTSVLTQLVDLDVTSDPKVTSAVEEVRKSLQVNGQDLWAVVNNAGVCIPGELQWLTGEQCQRMIQVNLEGAARVTRAFFPQLKLNKGRVVFVTSCFAEGGLPGVGLMAATSAGLEALADCLRLEARGQVKVSSVRLGDFSLATNLLSNQHREVGQMRRALSDVQEVDRFSAHQDAVSGRGLSLRSRQPVRLLTRRICATFEDALLARRPLRHYHVHETTGARLGRALLAGLPRGLRDQLIMRRFRRQLPKVTHL